jgi:hypothetical protein
LPRRRHQEGFHPHMKAKQFEALKVQHARHIGSCKLKEPEPDIEDAITAAIVNGQKLKLRSHAEILKSVREKVADCACAGYHSSGRVLKFSQILEFKAADSKDHRRKLAERDRRIAAYNKLAEPLMRKAELNDDADAETISELLDDAAKKARLREPL